MRAGWLAILAALTVILQDCAPALAATENSPVFAISLAPAKPDQSGYIRGIDVVLDLTGVEADAGERILKLPILANTVRTSADSIEGLVVADEAGTLAVAPEDEERDSSNVDRYWTAKRVVTGPIHIRYHVSIDPERPLLSLPQYELRTGGGTISGAANSFVILPDDDIRRRVRVHWELGAMDKGAIGISSFGVGDVDDSERYNSSQLASAYYMAGKAGLYTDREGGFFAAWQGSFGFPGENLMTWAAKLHRFYGDFFNQHPPHFGVFARDNPLNPGSGIGLTHSFAFTFATRTKEANFRSLLAHEMLHAWVNSLDETMDAPGGLAASWFGEGLAVHYQRTLPYRADLISGQAFLEDLNSTAGRYYTNAMIRLPNDKIASGFWRDTRIRALPYDRGSLYFDKIDAQIRNESGGKRSLDDIVRKMLAVRAAGGRMGWDLWRKLLRRELGQPGIDDFEAMLRGAIQVPPSGAFGPCFRRITRKLRRFDLGFDPDTLLDRPKVIKGLKMDSNAAKAGLQNGDEITNSFPLDRLQSDQDGWLTLKIVRNGKHMTVRYQPRGERVSAHQWERVEKVCAAD